MSNVRSIYLDELEQRAINEVRELNPGVSFNFVVRIALRQMLGLSAPQLVLPERPPVVRTGT